MYIVYILNKYIYSFFFHRAALTFSPGRGRVEGEKVRARGGGDGGGGGFCFVISA